MTEKNSYYVFCFTQAGVRTCMIITELTVLVLELKKSVKTSCICLYVHLYVYVCVYTEIKNIHRESHY